MLHICSPYSPGRLRSVSLIRPRPTSTSPSDCESIVKVVWYVCLGMVVGLGATVGIACVKQRLHKSTHKVDSFEWGGTTAYTRGRIDRKPLLWQALLVDSLCSGNGRVTVTVSGSAVYDDIVDIARIVLLFHGKESS